MDYEHVQGKIRLAPLTGADQIDANRNPYELLNNLKNIAPLGTFTTGHPPFLLQVPDESSPDRHPPSWSHNFFGGYSVVNMKITFPRPILLREVQLFCGGENDCEFPSALTVSMSESESGFCIPPVRNAITAPYLGYIWIRFMAATSARTVLLSIRKPTESFVVHFKQIRLLEQIEGDLNLDTIRNRLNESNIGLPHLLQYCYSTLMLPGSPDSLRVQLLAHFGPNESSEEEGKLIERALARRSRLAFLNLCENVEVLVGELCTLPNVLGVRNLLVGLRYLNDLVVHAHVQLEGGSTLMYLKALSSVLWSLAEAGNAREVESILTRDFVQKLYEWSMKLKNSEGKSEQTVVAVDGFIRSVCYCKPFLFVCLIHSMALLKPLEGTGNPTENLYRYADFCGYDILGKWFNDGSIWTKLKPIEFPLSLDLSCLELLGTCSMSPPCAKILKESSLLGSLHSAFLEFCKSFGTTEGNGRESLGQFENFLKFFRSLSFDEGFRDCLGVTQDFWPPLLKFLSMPPENLKSEMGRVQSAMADLLSNICRKHQENQKKVLPGLREAILVEDKLSPFCHRLLRQLVVDESSMEVFTQDNGMFALFQGRNLVPRVFPYIVDFPDLSPYVIISLRYFLELPRFKEVLLDEIFMYRTNLLFRVVLRMPRDMDGKRIFISVFQTLDTLPFEAVNWLLITSPPGQGELLRKRMVDNGSINYIVCCLNRGASVNSGQANDSDSDSDDDDDVEDCAWTPKIKSELEMREEKMVCLLNLLTNFIQTPPEMDEGRRATFQMHVFWLFHDFGVIKRVSDNLKNDSVLDIANHMSRYLVILQFLRALAAVPRIRPLLVSCEGDLAISKLLLKMKSTISQFLAAYNIKDLDLANLAKDIDATITQIEVKGVVKEFQKGTDQDLPQEAKKAEVALSPLAPSKTPEERYVEEMRTIQFKFIEMIGDEQVFKVPFHFESDVRRNGGKTVLHSRTMRLAQEIPTLSKSLPLSYASSIFLRCDNDRLDVFKALITGAAGTPYANGCFEFDIYFPMDYPNSPPEVNCVTIKGKGIKFIPHIYIDGEICLTLLNTFDGSREEMWDPKTSSLLPVLVAIQSVILTEDLKEHPQDFYRRARYCTLQHAILDQIKQPLECWKEVIQRHFWLKREEILAQCDQWSDLWQKMDLENQDLFKETVFSLKSTLMEMPRPEGLKPGTDLELQEISLIPTKQLAKRGLPAESNENSSKKKKIGNANCCVQ